MRQFGVEQMIHLRHVMSLAEWKKNESSEPKVWTYKTSRCSNNERPIHMDVHIYKSVYQLSLSTGVLENTVTLVLLQESAWQHIYASFTYIYISIYY